MTTLYLVAYDISDDRRRTKVHKILSGFGEWTQFSIFECFLNEQELILMRRRLDDVLKHEEDNVRFYHVCPTCQRKTETVGSDPPAEKSVYLL